MSRFAFASSVVVVVLAACGGGTAAIGGDAGANGQQLIKQGNGAATGDGATCSWAGTVWSASDPQTYALGASFADPDGCNTCSCSAAGITCSTRACGTGGDAGNDCTVSGVSYPPGQGFLAPDGCNHCICNGRGSMSCTLLACDAGATSSSSSTGGVACSDIAQKCPDGSFVSPVPPDCHIPDCPAVDCTTLGQSAEKEVNGVIQANVACAQDDDCVTVDFSANCFDACTRPMNKAGQAELTQAQADVNANQCVQFKKQGCTFPLPPCAAPLPPHCVNKSCQ